MELTYQNGVVIFEEKRIRIMIKYKEKYKNNIASLLHREKTLREFEREAYFFANNLFLVCLCRRWTIEIYFRIAYYYFIYNNRWNMKKVQEKRDKTCEK